MKNNLELRMYIFVPYNLSPIQMGIQAGHAALEYAYVHGKTKLFKDFVLNHKTWILLNGGTTRDVDASMEHGMEPGTLNKISYELDRYNIPHAAFREPDLNFALTAVCFIADERVFRFDLYPDWNGNPNDYGAWEEELGGAQNAFLRNLIRDKRLA